MAWCEICGRNMLTADGCGVERIHINGKSYPRIPMGGQGDLAYGQPKGTRCGDCGAAMGAFHHWGCDLERCPVCGRQLLSCDCPDVYIETPMG